jgi:CubicO group peptidase (beta-lactamase class C family)
MNPNSVQPLPVPGNDEIREILVNRVDQQKQAVGIVAGIIEPNGRRVVAYGSLANGDPRTVDGDTIFEIGSVSKVFTSLLLADMVNRKEVSLDDSVAKYLPDSVKIPERSGKSITLLDLATHTSGLPPLPSNLRHPYAAYSQDDLYQFLSGYELPREPGSKFEYSNLGAGLLGHLLAYRAGTDYERLIRLRITEPLGMPDTGITLSASMKQRMATGHNGILKPVPNWDFPTLAGAGALRSSANDILTFLEAFLGYKESSLAPAMKTMFQVRRPMGQAQIGLAWMISSAHDREIAGHEGGTGGFRSWVGYDPKERIGGVVLANTFTLIGVFDIGIHLVDRRWPLANLEPPEECIQIDSHLLDNYTGRYQLAPNRIFQITREGDRLFAQGFGQLPHNPTGDLIGGPMFELFAESENNFFVKETGSRITFETNTEGRATSLIMRRAGREPTPAPRLA